MTQPVVLIVSDDISKLSILRHVLQTSSHIVERPDFDSGLELLKSTSVDVVILDSKMGDVVDMADQFRSTILDTPILLITSTLKKNFIDAALHAGVTDFINEPLDKEEIEQRMAVAFRAKHRSQEISRIAKRSTPRGKLPKKTLSERELYTDEAIKAIEKSRSPVTVLMIELDNPQNIPSLVQADRHLATILEKNLRENDLLITQGVGRYILIFSKTSKRAAEIIAETIQYEVAFFPLLSVSIGLDELTPGYGSIKTVSRAFAEAKKMGNRIIAG